MAQDVSGKAAGHFEIELSWELDICTRCCIKAPAQVLDATA